MAHRCSFVIAPLLALAAAAAPAQTVRIAIIDPLSGPFANIGEYNLKHAQMAVDQINARGGVLGGQKLELVPLDSKNNPQEAGLVLQQAIDQNIRFVYQAAGSVVGGALLEAVGKHNARNPDRTVLYLNHGAIEPSFTNERCNFWHFRFDSHQIMKIGAFTDAIARDKRVRKAYLINQDYSAGQVFARETRAMLARKRPDIQIVGDDFHPLGKVKDFSPYIAKIKAAGADTVLTNNWGNDIALLIKASRDAGLDVSWYAMYVYLTGTPAAIGDPGGNAVKTLMSWHANIADNPLEPYANAYKARYKADWGWLPGYLALQMLARAIDQAKSGDPLRVALALEDMRYDGPTGQVWMRAEDHQLSQPLYVASFVRAGAGGVKYDVESTGFGWKTESRVEAKETVMPHTCRMQRPE
jgi:branched-chain amino acid transport system substrate-binding protein